MLLALNIKNIALIDEISLQFYHGFHVLSGETGAGKSIIVDALNLIIGNRADRSLIRAGCDKASVEASISIINLQSVKDVLDRELIPYEDEILVFRGITSNGKNVCRVNGYTVSLQLLQEIMQYIIDIHGQHSYHKLMQIDNHRKYIDDFGTREHQQLLHATKNAFDKWKESSRALKNLLSVNKEKELQFEITQKQLQELDELNLKEHEEEELFARKMEVDNFAKIRDAIKFSYYNLYGFANSSSILQSLQEVQQSMANVEDINEQFKNISTTLKNAYFELEDVTLQIRNLKDAHDFNEDEEIKISERLDQIKRAKRKYGDFSSITQKHAELQAKMDLFVSVEDKIKASEYIFKQDLLHYRLAADELSKSRKSLALDFENRIVEHIQELGMKDFQFKVLFSDDSAKKIPTSTGNDRVEFYISPNQGEPLKPLSNIASGGEMSRIMLALKTIEAEKNNIPCMIFDEVDSGISGKAAQMVGEKIAFIAKFRQVLAVSHLSQIAALADVQYMVEKTVINDRTITNVKKLNVQERVEEIARLVGVINESDTSGIVHAKNLLYNAQLLKEKIRN